MSKSFVLHADDEELILRMYKRMFQRHPKIGEEAAYECFPSGEDMLMRFRQLYLEHPLGRYLVITDRNMGVGMRGEEVIAALKGEFPFAGIECVMFGGNIEEVVIRRVQALDATFINKPDVSDTLKSRIRAFLDAA